ncbi:helix-turn-helix transcriptional regulator [Nocardia wallacei]|uniref:helix-turn-helix transcriptional regulator n=1 Tax=Nocardia wallacei TaxID=480035 RepID=UPI002455E261|nr:helix-turn-helix transcriptional regulator [Nocardia wallacei]
MPLVFWRRDDVRLALVRREVGRLFGIYLAEFPGCTQTQLALLTGHDRSDISNFIRGARGPRVADIDVLNRVADGLAMPDIARTMLGLAPAEMTIAEIEAGTPQPDATTDPPDTTSGSLPEPAPGDAFAVTQLLRTVTAALGTPDVEHVEWNSAPARVIDARPLPLVPVSEDDQLAETTRRITRQLIEVSQTLPLSAAETTRLAGLAGNLVDLDQHLDIAIGPDGTSQLTYTHALFNMSTGPVTRFSRELWFEHITKPLHISAIELGTQRVSIQRIHDTGNLSKFACQFSPPIRPGDTATFGYRCIGGQFVSDHYWRQGILRHTRRFTIALRHQQAGRVVACSAVEEHPDGSENSADEDLLWDYDTGDVLITVTRNHLRPNQAITIRWEVDHDLA